MRIVNMKHSAVVPAYMKPTVQGYIKKQYPIEARDTGEMSTADCT